MRSIAVLVMVVLLAAPGVADVVQLRNGDRISGTVLRLEAEELHVETPYAGEVVIDWSQVETLETETPQRVELEGGDDVVGTFSVSDEGVRLRGDTLVTPEPVSLSGVASIGLPDGPVWNGFVGISIAGTEGNTQTGSYGGRIQLTRSSKADEIRLSLRTNQQTQDSRTEVQTTVGRGEYDYSISDRWYISALTSLEHDRFRDLTLRTRVGGGPGYTWIQNPTMNLATLAGIAYVNENRRSSGDIDFISAVLSERFNWQIFENTSIYQNLDLYPNLEKGSDFVAHFDSGYRQALAFGISADLGLTVDYDNEPAPGQENEDIKYTLTLGYAF